MVYMIMSNRAQIGPRVNISAPCIRVRTHRATLFSFRSKAYEQRVQNHPLPSVFLFLFFPPCMADMPSDLMDSWRSVGWIVFFSLFIFPFFFSLSSCEVESTRKHTSRKGHPSVRAFFASNARRNTWRSDSLFSRVIIEMKVWGKRGRTFASMLGIGRTPSILYKSNEDDYS